MAVEKTRVRITNATTSEQTVSQQDGQITAFNVTGLTPSTTYTAEADVMSNGAWLGYTSPATFTTLPPLTARLVPSAWSRSNATYITFTDETNMYHTTDNTTYTTIRGRAGDREEPYYAYIRGFDFSAIPETATVQSFSVKIKAYRGSNVRTGHTDNYDYRLKLCSSPANTAIIADAILTDNLATSAAIYTFPTGAITWSDLVSYGDSFSVQIPISSTNGAYPRVYVYGAEVEVTYY